MLAIVSLFNLTELRDAPRVTTSFEFSVQPNLNNAINRTLANTVCRQAKDVDVIVASTPFRVVFVLSACCTNARMFVRSDVHSDSAATD
jgi:hypothetical protein